MPQGEKAVADQMAEVAAKAPAGALRVIEKAKARAVRSFALSGVTVSVTWGDKCGFRHHLLDGETRNT